MVAKCHVKRVTAVLLCLLITISFSGFYWNSTINAAGTINVSGRFMFANLPVRHARVEVWDSEWFVRRDEKITSGYTDSDGYYEFTGLNNYDGRWEDGLDIYVKCYARNWAADVIGNPRWVPDWFEGCTYNFQTSTISDVDDGDVWMGTKYAPTDMREAFNVLDTVLKGYDFLVSLGFNPGQATVFWDDWFHAGTSYFMPWSIAERVTIPDAWAWLATIITGWLAYLGVDMAVEEVLRSLRGLHIVDGDGWKASTILHEYGHFVMEKYADFWPPDSVLTHYYDVAYNPEHAWVEGWAHFFSAAARHWAGYSDYKWTSRGYNIEDVYQGDNVEGAVAGVLWDIYDQENEATDTLALGFWPIWNVLLNHEPPFWYDNVNHRTHPWNIYDFFWGFYTKYPSAISGAYKIFDLHGITVPGVQPPPKVEISPDWRLLEREVGSSVSYTIEVTNVGSETDTFELSLSGLDLFDTSYNNLLTIGPGQAETTTLTVTSSGNLVILGDYYFFVEAKSTTPLYMREDVRALLSFDFIPTLPSTPQGGLAVAIIPKASSARSDRVFRGFRAEIDIDVINNQNFDDAITIKLSFTGIPPEFRAVHEWFRVRSFSAHELWRTDKIFIPAMSSFTLRLTIRIPSGDSFEFYKLFKVTATSAAWLNGYAQDAGTIHIES